MSSFFIFYFVVSKLYENYNQVTETENNALLIKAKIISIFGKKEYNKKGISVGYLDNNDYYLYQVILILVFFFHFLIDLYREEYYLRFQKIFLVIYFLISVIF